MNFFEKLCPDGAPGVNRRQAIVCLSVFALSACSPSSPVLDDGVDYYTCPMHPSVHSHKPNDKCPICGMDLIPVMKQAIDPAPASTSSGIVNIPPDGLREIGARSEVVSMKQITRSLKAPARCAIDESSLRDINVTGDGFITKLNANSEGKSFHKGDVLMTVILDQTSRPLEVLAPFDCFVHKKNAIEGMSFKAGQSLLEIADHRKTWIVAEFPESQSMYVTVGQMMTVTFPAMPGHQLEAPIDFIDPHVNDQARRLMARIVISDETHMFHPGLFAEVSAEIPLGSQLTVPASAVIPTGHKFIVFVDHGEGKLEPREIQVGVQSDNNYEVISGLKEGEKVISSATFLIDAESRIQGVLKTWGTNE